MTRTLSIVALIILLAGCCVAQQPLLFDTFDGPGIDARWTVDSGRDASATIEPTRGVLILQGPENRFNHIEAPLPEGADYVQVDVCSVNDVSASWTPSLVVYWGAADYARLMFSTFYSLRLEAQAAGEPIGAVRKVALNPGEWYRGAVRISADRLSFLFGPADGELVEVGAVDRPASWTGPATLIIGKGYMPKSGNPDFDNNYQQAGAPRRVEFDNLVVGDPAPLAQQLADSAAQRAAGVAHDPTSLQVAFWPNTANPATTKTLWLAPDVYQRLCLIYSNTDKLNAAHDFAVQLRVPPGIELREVTFGEVPVGIEREQGDGFTEYTLRPEGYSVPADHHGSNLEDPTQPDWYNWPVSPRTPGMFIHCIGSKQADGGTISARATARSGAGPWHQMTVAMVDPLPELLPAQERDLGLSLWDGHVAHPGPGEDVVSDQTLALYARLGVKRLHISPRNADALIPAAKAHGIQPFLTSWWHYAWQNTADSTPTEQEKASVSTTPGANFCPVIIAEGSGTYGQFLETVTEQMKQHAWEGYMLDYECAMPLCFCDRCKQAFIDHTGLADVSWPDDVKKDARYYRQWIDFRCHQGALYVKSIRDAAYKVLPGCPMQAWVAGYDYNGTIESATIDVSKASEYMTEPEVPHYTLPGDYSDMWTEDVGIGSIEAGIAAVEESLPVVNRPIIFCSSIIYPMGSKTPWSDPQLLDVQIQTIIAAGARGVSFWGGHFAGATDGRYMHKLIKWHNLLVLAGDFLWEGERDDSLAQVSDEDTRTLRRFVWSLGDRRLLALTNLTQEDKSVAAGVKGCGTRARNLLTGEAVDLSKPLTMPALDGVFLTLEAN